MKILEIIDYMENHQLTFIVVMILFFFLVVFLYEKSIEDKTTEINKQIEDSILVQWCSKGCSHMMTLVGEVHNLELSEKCLNRCVADVDNK